MMKNERRKFVRKVILHSIVNNDNFWGIPNYKNEPKHRTKQRMRIIRDFIKFPSRYCTWTKLAAERMR